MQNRSLERQREYTSVAVEQAIDKEHIRLLAIFHYVLGGFTLATASFFLIYLFMGVTMMLASAATTEAAEAGAQVAGGVFAAVSGALVFGGWLYGGLTIYAGRCLQTYRHRTFTIVMSAINCLQMPWGLILGLLTIKVLLRNNVREGFERRALGGAGIISAPSAGIPSAILAADAFAAEEDMWREMEEKSRARKPPGDVPSPDVAPKPGEENV